LAFVLMQPQRLAAQTLGTAFTYQGHLLSSNAPASSLQDFKFRVLTAVTGGSQVGPIVTNLNVVVTNGLFTTKIDLGAGAFTGDQRFLEISVRPAGFGSFTVLSPRSELTPTPYAIFALSAASIATPCPRRKFYMTSSFPTGSAALTACVAGYHMASFQELMDVGSLQYATDLGSTAHTLPDAGSGPPFSTLAFVRTGVSDPAAGNTVAGNANCNVWTSASTTEFGTVIALKPTWTDAPSNVSPWDAITKECDNVSDATPPAGTTGARVHVWCVED
jgi:hypothetical protein